MNEIMASVIVICIVETVFLIVTMQQVRKLTKKIEIIRQIENVVKASNKKLDESKKASQSAYFEAMNANNIATINKKKLDKLERVIYTEIEGKHARKVEQNDD